MLLVIFSRKRFSLLWATFALSLTGFAQTGAISHNATLEQDELLWTWTANNVNEVTLTYQVPAGTTIVSFDPIDNSGWLFEGVQGQDWDAEVEISDQTQTVTVTLTRYNGTVSGTGMGGGGTVVVDDWTWRVAHPAPTSFFLSQNPSENLAVSFRSPTTQPYTLGVFNGQGQRVLTAQIEPGTERVRDMVELPSGLYYIRIMEEHTWAPLHWVKQ